MATDWWLLRNCEEPVLRLYSWDKPTLSIGYRQQFEPPADLQSIIPSFRSVLRPTGGGYLFHGDEITYSITSPKNTSLSNQSITKSYGLIEQSFESALHSIDVLPEETSHGTNEHLTENCLDEAAQHEPTVNQKKWMASSQTRHLGRFLQHGSLFWTARNWPDKERFSKPYFLGSNATNNHSLSKQTVIEALIRHVDRTLFDDRKLLPYNTSINWEEIRAIRNQFQVSSYNDLPKFRRHSDGLRPCGNP